MRTLSPTATAILLMIGAIFCFSVMDATAKALAPRIGTIPAVWARYAGQALVVLILVAPRLRSVARTNYPWLQLARSVFLMFGTVFFFFSVANIGLTEATAIMNVNPVIISNLPTQTATPQVILLLVRQLKPVGTLLMNSRVDE